ncbi:MAG: fructose-bisphosphate aldolase class I [Actinomycetota bacterium]|nr:fructose-bisphosphate aldolase class I [Actinomycetota bacterium]
MNAQELEKTARSLVPEGKGILAADESFGTIGKRFKAVGVEASEESRRDYRELLFTTPGISDYLAGVILFDETIRQKASDGRLLPEILEEQGVIPGIKVDGGAKDMALSPGEKLTEGLDGLRERLGEYREMGARFAKWRAVITIGDGIPTQNCIDANAFVLARYAAACQEQDIVPIVEPEVLIDGDHSIEQFDEVTEKTLRATFARIFEAGVDLKGMLLKPNMVISGKDASEQAPVEEVARRTVECLLRSVPAAVPGIVFLSGGQSDKQATAHLNAMNKLYPNLPYELSFSYARALQDLPMKTWKGDAGNAEAAQKAFYHRLKMNGAARYGAYSEEMEEAA